MDDLLTSILPAFVREGKSYLTIAMGCTGGRHRSVALAEALAERLREHGHPVVGLPPGHRPVSGTPARRSSRSAGATARR